MELKRLDNQFTFTVDESIPKKQINNIRKVHKIKCLLDMEHGRLSDKIACVKYDTGDNEHGLMCDTDGRVAFYSVEKLSTNDFRGGYKGEMDINGKTYYIYNAGKANSTSVYEYVHLPLSSIQMAKHVIIAIAFGLFDKFYEEQLKELCVCHRVAVTKKECNNSLSNLFVDTLEFNNHCAIVEKMLRKYKPEVCSEQMIMDRDTITDWEKHLVGIGVRIKSCKK